MADLKSLEHPTLKVPYEVLNKKFRAGQKTVDREVSHVQNSITELEKSLFRTPVQVDQICSLLGATVDKLQTMKRKVEEAISDELDAAQNCKRRVEHLKLGAVGIIPTTDSSITYSLWKKTRVERYLVEHLLRAGHYNTAQKMVEQNPELAELTNLDIFLVARNVELTLAQQQTQAALAWIHDHKSKLRKIKSTLEFHLRQQEFVELIRSDRRMDAVRHARKYLTNMDDVPWEELQHALALLAFPSDTQVSPYKELLDTSRWNALTEEFRQDYFRLYQLAPLSVLAVALQAGLSAMKTPQCYRPMDQRNAECPVCQEPLNKLAERLPHAHCSQSRLICRLSGLPLNEHNLPMMLPNGRVYGEQALRTMASSNNGMVTCPRTKEVFAVKDAEKVYVM
ncbi:E3 ubiquitin-protein transferase MAEA-like [Daphnia pulex]|uniref:E3 ubiquitin-protein transferase MAEA-like n=1 Tax=Daphnia pulex TaxID=6669 RepID=UPI001EDD21ED|nr:E3 ubiquitin-protein transferase MAEA-like [Daphnia pulex]XP_046643539.1 E3 ubiquitin-protein transferase MAEA-like [Daphnia pulicaria]